MQFRVLPPEGRADPRFPQGPRGPRGPRGPHPRPARGPTSPRRSLNQPGVKGEGALRSAREGSWSHLWACGFHVKSRLASARSRHLQARSRFLLLPAWAGASVRAGFEGGPDVSLLSTQTFIQPPAFGLTPQPHPLGPWVLQPCAFCCLESPQRILLPQEGRFLWFAGLGNVH